MAQEKLIRSTSEFIDTINSPAYQLGLYGKPVSPWYIGQPDTGGKLVPAFFKAGIDLELERELLREFRMQMQEFSLVKGLSDADILIAAHNAGVPTRILDWLGNPMAALFLAVESMAMNSHGKIWILNPWKMNELLSKLTFVHMTDNENFAKYVVKLNDPDADPQPEAVLPMAFRTFRTSRPANAQAIYYTVFGKNTQPLEEIKTFFVKASDFLTYVLIEGERKRVIMKELHNMGITRANLFPGPPSLVRTLTYRFTDAYMKTNL